MLNFSKHFSLRAALDGLINALLINLALDFTLSAYAVNMALEWSFVISAFCAVMGSLVFFSLLFPVQKLARTAAFMALSLVSFLICFLLFFLLPSPFPLRPTNNADGLLIMFLALNFSVIAALGRIVAFIRAMLDKSIKRSNT